MKKVLISLFLTAFILALNTAPAAAKVVSSEGPFSLGKDEVVNDDLFVGGETVTIEGTVNGDLYAAGGMVTIKGVVIGDVFAAGGMVTVSGEVGDDVRVAGGNLTVSGAQIGDSLTVFGGNVLIDESTIVGGGVILGSGSVSLAGDVRRGVVGGAGALTLDGKVGKDMEVGVGTLALGSGAEVSGDLTYHSEEDASINESAAVSGEIKKILPEMDKTAKDLKGIAAAKPWSRIARQARFGFRAMSYFAAFVIGFLLLHFFRKQSEAIADKIRRSPWRSLGWGFLTMLLIGPALLLLMITVVGIPLAIILGGLFVVELYLVKIFVAILLGKLVAEGIGREKMSIYLSFAIGLAVYYIATSLPIAGFFLKVLFLFFGIGAIVSFKRDLLTASRK